MKSKLITLPVLVFITIWAQAQTLHRPVAANYIALSAYSFNHVDVFSFTANQASLAQLENNSAAVYAERKFMLNELNNYTAAIGLKTSSGNFGLEINYSGFSGYKETQIGFAYGRKLGSKIDIGAQFNYNSISISNGYGNASAITFEAGTIFHVTDKLHTGFHISNPVGGKFGKEHQEKLSSTYSFGIGYDASQKLLVSAEIEKEEAQPVNINAGFQYKIISSLLVRAGISSATSSVWGGAGLLLKSFRIDITTNYHPQLGITPGVLMLFNFNNSKK